MRNPSSASFQPFRGLFVIAATMIVATCGCSQMALKQPPNFKAISQPKPLSQREQQSVDSILERQDEIRLAAKEAEQQAEADAVELEGELTAQMQDIVSEAAARAESVETSLEVPARDFAVAQVSFENDIDSGKETEQEAEDPAPTVDTEFEASDSGVFAKAEETLSGESETPENNVRLTANIDGMDSIPFNRAREDFDFTTANLLRPSNQSTVDDNEDDSSESVPPKEITNAIPSFDESSETLKFPLQPMLFNPETRTTKTIVEGTLRPMSTKAQLEAPEVEVEKASPEVADAGGGEFKTVAFNPLAPLGKVEPSTIKLEPARELDAPEPETAASRLLQPIERAMNEIANLEESPPQPVFTPPNTPDVAPANFDVVENVGGTPAEEMNIVEEAPPTPTFVSEKIIVVDPPKAVVKADAKGNPEVAVATESKAEVPSPMTPIQIPEYVPQRVAGQPVVDETLAQASVNYLEPKPTKIEVTEEAFIPAEVFEDAIAVAEDLEREMMAESIPVGPIETPNNDFKVRPASNTTVSDAVTDDESESNTFKPPVHADRGEPMFRNNDFAAPASPGGEFIPPMTVTPSEVPKAIPELPPTASANFGNPVELKAPPETDKIVAHVAALPTNGFDTSVETSKVPPVGISTLMELNTVTWKTRLDEAIELAEERLDRMNQPTDSGLVNLRLLKALRGQMEHMETSSEELSSNESQYWQHQLEAITSMLQTPGGENRAITDYHRHQTAHKTLDHLRNAVSQLESIASLKVTSGQFCTEITGFGQFRTFPSNSFTAGQKMLVYCEVENYRTIEQQSVTGNDFRTRLKGSFAIYDSNGKVVQQAEYPTVDDLARKKRRDFYMYMPVTLSDLPAGNYVLHALVEDVHGNKTASLDPPLQFSVQ